MTKFLKRTPRNFTGKESTNKLLNSLCKDFLQTVNQESFSRKEEVLKAWYGIIGDQLRGLTQVISWRKGVLTIKVKSPVLYSMLCTHENSRLLAKLQNRVPNQVKEIKFWQG
jgi:hypothetical protein